MTWHSESSDIDAFVCHIQDEMQHINNMLGTYDSDYDDSDDETIHLHLGVTLKEMPTHEPAEDARGPTLDRMTQCLQLTQERSNERTLILLSDAATLKRCGSFLGTLGAPWEEFRGSDSVTSKKLRRFQTFQTRVLLLNTQLFSSGLVIPCSDNIIVWSAASEHMLAQLQVVRTDDTHARPEPINSKPHTNPPILQPKPATATAMPAAMCPLTPRRTRVHVFKLYSTAP